MYSLVYMILLIFAIYTLWHTVGKGFPLETIPRYFRSLKPGDPEFYNEKGERINTHVKEWIEQRDAALYIRPNDVVLELGARYGTVTSVINRKLINKAMHVAVEPDKRVLNALKTNLARSQSYPWIFQGFVSNSPQRLENVNFWDGYGANSAPGNSDAPYANVAQLESRIGARFTALVADCEGCLENVLNENPTLMESLNVLLFEADGNCNYTSIRNNLLLANMTEVRRGFHNVWVRVKEA